MAERELVFFNNVTPANCTALQCKVTHFRIYGRAAHLELMNGEKDTHVEG